MTNSIRDRITGFNLPARFGRFLCIAALATSAIATRADLQMFMQLVPADGTGVPEVAGTSTDPMYKGEDGFFELKGFNIKVQNLMTIGSASGGAGAGKAQFVEFSIAKDVTPGTPAIFKTLAAGGHWKYARVLVRKPGVNSGKAYLEYNFNLVFATSQEWTGAAAESLLTENVKFAYGALQIRYWLPPTSTGQPAAKLSEWNQVSNNDDFDNVPEN